VQRRFLKGCVKSAMKVNVLNGEISEREKRGYVQYALNKHRGRQIDEIDICLNGEFVDVKVHFCDVDFQHAYRSADYLVDTLEKMNDAKQVEFSDKTTHTIGDVND